MKSIDILIAASADEENFNPSESISEHARSVLRAAADREFASSANRNRTEAVQPSRPHRMRGYRFIGVAAVALVAVVGITIGTLNNSVEPAQAQPLEQLQRAAAEQSEAHGVMYTQTEAQWFSFTVGAEGLIGAEPSVVNRQAWFAADGSWRLRETNSQGTVADETFPVGDNSKPNYSIYPIDPDELKTKILQISRDSGSSENETKAIFTGIGDLLREGVVPADVRSAAFGVLSQLSGLTINADARDHDNRTSISVTYTEAVNGQDHSQTLFFDKQTSELLGEAQTTWEKVNGTLQKFDSWSVVKASKVVDSLTEQ